MKCIEEVIVAHLNDEASTEEVERLFEWVREDPENAKEFARCSLLHAQLRGQFVGETLMGETSTSSQYRESRRHWMFIVAAVAACLLIVVGTNEWWRFAGQRVGDDLVVLAPFDPTIANKPQMPFAMEKDADVIAIAVMGPPQSHHDRQVMRMELVELLKGDPQVRSLESADGVIAFGCIVPENPRRFSEMHQAGERVAVYLNNTGDGWSTLQMTALTEEHEAQWKVRVQSFLAVLLASEVDDPEQRYAELLGFDRQHVNQLAANGASKAPADGKAKRVAGLSDASYYGLLYNPDPHAAKFLRKMLIASVDYGAQNGLVPGSRKAKQGAGNPKGSEASAENAITPPAENSPQFTDADSNAAPLIREDRAARRQAIHRLVTLLVKMHDAHSVRPIMTYTALLSESERIGFLRQFPELCQDAEVDTLRFVHKTLSDYIAVHDALGSPEPSTEPSPELRPVRSPQSRPADGKNIDASPQGSSTVQKQKGQRTVDNQQHDYYRTLLQTRQAIEKLLER